MCSSSSTGNNKANGMIMKSGSTPNPLKLILTLSYCLVMFTGCGEDNTIKGTPAERVLKDMHSKAKHTPSLLVEQRR